MRIEAADGTKRSKMLLGRWHGNLQHRASKLSTFACLFQYQPYSAEPMPPSTAAQTRRLYAFEVPPQRNVEKPLPPAGGLVQAATTVSVAIDESTESISVGKWIDADLQIDSASQDRSHVIRNLAIAIAFGSDADALSGAAQIAAHLSACTDRRSKDSLLMIVVADDDKATEVKLWTFPQDSVFQFSPSRRLGKGPSVQATEAFSRGSHLRKAAVFRGQNRRTDFLSCRVVDFQVNASARAAADFWIEHFLDARLSLGSALGTKILAKVLRETVGAACNAEERLELVGAAQALRQSNREKWSIASVADELLREPARSNLLAHPVAKRNKDSLFSLDRDAFDKLINFRVYQLDTGVWVSAPFTDEPEGVEIEKAGDDRRLTATGLVVAETVRSRHA